MQDRLPGRLVTQDVDLPGSAARAKSATRHRFQDGEFDQPKCVARLHSPSLRADSASPTALPKRAIRAERGAGWRRARGALPNESMTRNSAGSGRKRQPQVSEERSPRLPLVRDCGSVGAADPGSWRRSRLGVARVGLLDLEVTGDARVVRWMVCSGGGPSGSPARPLGKRPALSLWVSPGCRNRTYREAVAEDGRPVEWDFCNALREKGEARVPTPRSYEPRRRSHRAPASTAAHRQAQPSPWCGGRPRHRVAALRRRLGQGPPEPLEASVISHTTRAPCRVIRGTRCQIPTRLAAAGSANRGSDRGDHAAAAGTGVRRIVTAS